MERILRSVLQLGGLPETDDAFQNWQKLKEHDLDFSQAEDHRIYQYLDRFYSQMSAPPDFALVREYFEKLDDIESVDRLEEVKKAQSYIRTNFLSIIKSEQEQQQVKKFSLMCREAAHIAEHGRNLDKPVQGKKVLRGVPDALGFAFDKMSSFTNFDSGEKLEGDVTEDIEVIVEEHDKVAKNNQFSGRNLFGLEPVDSACSGHKKGEFWVHCAFAGELKTSLALNYFYNNTFVYGKNIFYAILEMPFRQLQRQLFVIHSANGKFVTDWYEKDKKAGLKTPYLGIDYRSVRDGTLDPLSRQRLAIVAQDFKANSKGRPYIWRPGTSDVKMDDIRRKAEMFHNKYGCDGIIIDYLALVSPKHRTQDYVTSINSVVTEARWLALGFARGQTVPVLGLFQLNRQGKMRADKNDGRYDSAAISYANQIEKDADVITYTYLNDVLRKEGKYYLGCLKNRDGEVFDRMVGKIMWQCKRMRAIQSGLLDMDMDKLEEASKRMVSMSMEDMIQ